MQNCQVFLGNFQEKQSLGSSYYAQCPQEMSVSGTHWALGFHLESLLSIDYLPINFSTGRLSLGGLASSHVLKKE